MMRNFTNEDFDEFLKENAEEFRMRPSLKVWKNISSELKKRRRRIFFTTIGFMLVTGAAGYLLMEGSGKIDPPVANVTPEKPNTNLQPADKSITNVIADEPIYRVPGTQYPSNNEQIAANTNQPSTRARVIEMRSPVTKKAEETIPADNTEKPEAIVIAMNEPQEEFVPQVVDNDPLLTEEESIEKSQQSNEVADPMTIESVVNSYKLISRNSKLAMQVFFTPTVSYRKLSENKGYTSQPASSNGINYPAMYSINDAVTHKPDMGLELGLTAKYALDNTIKLRGGLQFNVSRYDIKAYTYTSELATIALSRGGSGSVERRDEISSYRNFDGNRPDWLQNMYFQVSAPIGMEMKISGNDKASFGVASTLQPTYMLGERAYMLSSDYKNYTKVPELVRRWNVATNLETFVSYSTGDVKWQVGPQVRYQLFSSFVSKYPVKEHLFDFGLKVGVSLNRKPVDNR